MFTSMEGIAVKNGNPVCCNELLFTTVSRSITLHLERILWASPGFTQIKDRFLTWFVHSTFHYRRFDISTLFKRPRMFCLATTTVLINCVSVKLRLPCETFQFSSVLWLLCAKRDLHLPVTCRRRFLRLQLCKLQLQHGWEHAGAARLLSESKVYCLSFVKTCLSFALQTDSHQSSQEFYAGERLLWRFIAEGGWWVLA